MTADPEPSMPPLIPSGGRVGLSPFTSRRFSASFLPSPKYKAVFLALLLVCLVCSVACGGQYKVVRVADGDTITILGIFAQTPEKSGREIRSLSKIY